MENLEGGLRPSGNGAVPVATLCEKDYNQTGVSLRYAQDPTKKWYVFRASYGRETKAYRYFIASGEVAYLPFRYVHRKIEGNIRIVQEPMLPNILFVYCTYEKAKQYVKRIPNLQYLQFYYNHLIVGPDGKNPPLTISFEQMMNFIAVTSAHDEHVRVVNPARCHFKSGDRVRITNGTFIGVEGRVARVSGQQRVVVEIEGLCSIATAYIPTAFLEVIVK